MASAIDTFEMDDFDTPKPSLEEFQESMRKFNYTDEESLLFYKYSSIIDNLILIIEEELESTKELESKKDTDDELLELEEEIKRGESEESEESSKNTTLINLLESIGIHFADTFVNTKKIKNNLIFILNCIETEIQVIQKGGKRSCKTQKQRQQQRQKQRQQQRQQQKQQKKQQRQQKTQRQKRRQYQKKTLKNIQIK
jgi:transcription initiation factor TFIID subunit TAF12